MSLPVLFFAPHQDDETLLMGVEIVRHVTAGRPATVICAGDGSTSGALPALNGKATCSWHGYRHDPEAEGRSTLTGGQMGKHRTAEQRSACVALGATKFVAESYPEDRLTVSVWRQLLLDHEPRVKHGGSVFVPTPWETTSGYGNPDHGNAGLAMRQLREEGYYSGAKGIWVGYSVFSRYWTIPGCPDGITRGPETSQERARLMAAADAYRAWNPCQGSLAIGWQHSVPGDFYEQFVNSGSPRYMLTRYHT